METEKTINKGVGRFHILPWGGGQITVPKDMVKGLELKSCDRIMIERKEDGLYVTKF